MHKSVMDFVAAHRARILAPVLEIGARNVNGSIRELDLPEPYVGVDLCDGPGVTLVCDATELPYEDGHFATAISVSMLEHALYPVKIIEEMVRVLRPGGTLILTAAANGFPQHNEPDRWRFMPGTLIEIVRGLGLEGKETADPQVSGAFVVARKPE